MIFLILFQCVQRDLERKEIEEESKGGKSAPHASHVAKLSNSRPFPVLAVSYPSAILFDGSKWFPLFLQAWEERNEARLRGASVESRCLLACFVQFEVFFFFLERD